MKYPRIFISLFVAALASSTLFAQEATTPTQSTKTPRINERQIRQQKRIREGVKSGELTKKETRRLEAGEAKIQSDKLEAKADGKVTKAERAKLTREQNRESKAIHRMKHNKAEAK